MTCQGGERLSFPKRTRHKDGRQQQCVYRGRKGSFGLSYLETTTLHQPRMVKAAAQHLAPISARGPSGLGPSRLQLPAGTAAKDGGEEAAPPVARGQLRLGQSQPCPALPLQKSKALLPLG